MKIVAFAGSLSRTSINKQLIEHAARLLTGGIAPGSEVEVLDLNDYEAPLYSPERENDGVPQQAHDLYNKIGSADAVLVSFPEYNSNYSAAYKNIFDWMSRIDTEVYHNKPTVMLAASPGRRAGAGVLEIATSTAPYFGVDLKGSLGVGSWYDAFDAEAGELTDPDLKVKLADVLAALVA